MEKMANQMLQRVMPYSSNGTMYVNACPHIATCQTCANKLTKNRDLKCPTCRSSGDCFRQVFLPNMDDDSVTNLFRRTYTGNTRKRKKPESSSNPIDSLLVKAINHNYTSSNLAESLKAFDKKAFFGNPCKTIRIRISK